MVHFQYLLLVMNHKGRGDLVGSDLEHQLNSPHHSISVRCGYDVKALTYCELKSIQIKSLSEVIKRFHKCN